MDRRRLERRRRLLEIQDVLKQSSIPLKSTEIVFGGCCLQEGQVWLGTTFC